MNISAYMEIACENNIDVDNFPMRAIKSFSRPGQIAIDTEKISTFLELKDCLSHELGPCMTGSFYNIKNKLDVRARHEVRANRWKIQHEIPRGAFFDALEHGITEIWQLAEHFDVTEDFMRMAADYYIENPLD